MADPMTTTTETEVENTGNTGQQQSQEQSQAQSQQQSQEQAQGESKSNLTAAQEAELAKLLEEQGLQIIETGDGKKTLAKTVTYDGRTYTKTIEELVKDAEKAGGADEKFRKAAELRNQATTEAQIGQLVLTMRDESKPMEERLDAMRKFGVLLGDDPAAVEQSIQQYLQTAQVQSQQGPQGQQGASGNTKGQGGQGGLGNIDLSKLPPEVQEAVKFAQEAQAERDRQAIYEVIEKGVDTDPILGKLPVESPGEGQPSPRDKIKDLAKREVAYRVLVLGEDFGPKLVGDVLQELRTLPNLFTKPDTPAEGRVRLELPREAVHEYPELLSLGGVVGGSPPLQAGAPGAGGGSESGRPVYDPTDPNWMDSFLNDVRRHMNERLSPSGKSGSK